MQNIHISNKKIYRDLDLLFPPLKSSIIRGISLCAQKGINIKVFETYRTADRQLALWDQGRKSAGKIITKAQPWMSRHQYGIACDVAFMTQSGWSWSGDIKTVSDAMTFFGLRSLSWDPLHFEWPTDVSTEIMYAISKKNGLLAIWAELNLINVK